jgi:hypothetical protein
MKHRQVTGHLDDDGRPVAATDFDFAALDPQPEALLADEVKRIRLETIVQLLRMLDRGRDATIVGRRLIFLAFLVKASQCKTQRELARRLNISPSRVSQKLNAVKREFALLAERL